MVCWHPTDAGVTHAELGRKEGTNRFGGAHWLAAVLLLVAALAGPAHSLDAQQYAPGSGTWVMAFNHNNGFDPVAPMPGNQPQPPGTATNPYAPFDAPQFHSVFVPGPGWLSAKFANPFKAIHMSLIPKGPNRGKVLVWDDFPVIFRCTNFAPEAQPNQVATHYWAYQAYSIVDPSPDLGPGDVRFQNFLLPIHQVDITQNLGEDLFCSGHCWSSFGDLVVAAGTLFGSLGQQSSGKATYVYNPAGPMAPFPGQSLPLYGPPAIGLWAQGPNLEVGRYYPTTVLIHRIARGSNPPREMIPILGGGTIDPLNPLVAPASWNNYEALVVDREANITAGVIDAGISKDFFGSPGPVPLWLGPGHPGNFTLPSPNIDWLEIYPRAHFLTNGKVFVSGFQFISAYVNHATTIWNDSGFIGHPPTVWSEDRWYRERIYGASVRYPNTDGYANRIVRLGGFIGDSGILESTETVEWIDAAQPGATWDKMPSMNHKRAWLNVVLTPDGSLIAFGGAGLSSVPSNPPHYPGADPLYHPEILSPGAPEWTDCSPALSVRDYHSAPLLLPDGRILIGGGEHRNLDYEVFEPPYFSPDPDGGPQGVHILGQEPLENEPFLLNYTDSFTIKCNGLPPGVALERAVLMAPGSTTHHSDMSQRYHQLVVAPDQSALACTPPANDTVLPRGFYMLFVTTNTGRVSSAIWVRLQ